MKPDARMPLGTQVFSSALPDFGPPGEVALKVMDVPDTAHDCTVVEVFSEVALLERLAGRPTACGLYDYGLDGAQGSHMAVVLL